MTEKRIRKLERPARRRRPPHYWGDPDADIGILTWGSTGPVEEAIGWRRPRARVAGMAPKMVWPVPDGADRAVPRGKQDVLVAEVNYSGQFALDARPLPVRAVSVTVYSGEAFTVARRAEIEGAGAAR